MKTHLTSQRDRDFMRACREVIASSRRTDLTVAEVAARAAASRAPSYYMTFDYALRALREERAGVRKAITPAVVLRRREIAAKVRRLMESRPGLSESDALTFVLTGPASSFFINPDTARRLYIRLRHSRKRT